MTAPAGVSSGSAPEPAAQATTDPQAAAEEAAGPALAAAVPQPAPEPVFVANEQTLTVAGSEMAAAEPEMATAEAEMAAAEPEMAAAGGEIAAAEADGESRGQSAAGVRDRGPSDEEPARRSGKARGVRLVAVAAGVIGVLLLVGAAVAALAVVTHGFRPKTEVRYREAAVFSLRTGECINSSPNGLSVTILSCATPHDAEVFATYRLTGSSWPGGGVIQQDASSGCMSRVAGYVNPQLADAGFTQEYVFPDQQAWTAGVRTVVCEIRASSGQLTGSVRQAG